MPSRTDDSRPVIGLTYDLRRDYEGQGFSSEELAELDSPETIDAIEGTLVELGNVVVRVGNRPAVSFTVAPPSGAPAEFVTLPITTPVDVLALWAACDASTDRHTTTAIEATRMVRSPA